MEKKKYKGKWIGYLTCIVSMLVFFAFLGSLTCFFSYFTSKADIVPGIEGGNTYIFYISQTQSGNGSGNDQNNCTTIDSIMESKTLRGALNGNDYTINVVGTITISKSYLFYDFFYQGSITFCGDGNGYMFQIAGGGENGTGIELGGEGETEVTFREGDVMVCNRENPSGSPTVDTSVIFKNIKFADNAHVKIKAEKDSSNHNFSSFCAFMGCSICDRTENAPVIQDLSEGSSDGNIFVALDDVKIKDNSCKVMSFSKIKSLIIEKSEIKDNNNVDKLIDIDILNDEHNPKPQNITIRITSSVIEDNEDFTGSLIHISNVDNFILNDCNISGNYDDTSGDFSSIIEVCNSEAVGNAQVDISNCLVKDNQKNQSKLMKLVNLTNCQVDMRNCEFNTSDRSSLDGEKSVCVTNDDEYLQITDCRFINTTLETSAVVLVEIDNSLFSGSEFRISDGNTSIIEKTTFTGMTAVNIKNFIDVHLSYCEFDFCGDLDLNWTANTDPEKDIYFFMCTFLSELDSNGRSIKVNYGKKESHIKLKLEKCKFVREKLYIYKVSELKCELCYFSDNLSTTDIEGGGAIYIDSTTNPSILTNCTFNSNASAMDGGAIYTKSSSTLTSCIFNSNVSDMSGGAIYSSGSSTSLKVDTCVFDSNISKFDNAKNDNGGGGAIYASGSIQITGSKFKNDISKKYGGAIYAVNVIAMDCDFIKNVSDAHGGGVYCTGNFYGLNRAEPTLIDVDNPALNCKFIGNKITTKKSTSDGGGLYAGGSIKLANCVFEGNAAMTGSGLCNDTGTNDIDLKNSQFIGNISTDDGNGGAIQCAYGTIQNCIIKNNINKSALTSKGTSIAGINFRPTPNKDGTLKISSSEISDNVGIAILYRSRISGQMLTLENCNISGNIGLIALYNQNGAYGGEIATFNNCMISNNCSYKDNKGVGLITNDNGGSDFATRKVIFNGCKIYTNSCTDDGAVFQLKAPLEIVVNALETMDSKIYSDIYGNEGKLKGGVFRVCDGGKLTINNANFGDGNKSNGGKGDLIYVENGGQAFLNEVNVEDSLSEHGFIEVENGGILILTKCNILRNNIVGGGSIKTNGSVYLSSVNISGNKGIRSTDDLTTIDGNGGGIYVGSSGTLLIDDKGETSKIEGNSAKYGGGVYVDGTFIMHSGEIGSQNLPNEAHSAGGGVYIGSGGNFIMHGGAIQYCSASNGNGGGVYVKGNFTLLNDSKISHCSATYGGGVYVDTLGKLIIKDNGEISHNECLVDNSGHGTGISNDGYTLMEGGSISYNNCDDTRSVSGAGVYCGENARFIMHGGSISNNKTSDQCDGTAIYSTGISSIVTLDDVEISENTGGSNVIYIAGKLFRMEGGEILRNDGNIFCVNPSIDMTTVEILGNIHMEISNTKRFISVMEGGNSSYISNIDINDMHINGCGLEFKGSGIITANIEDCIIENSSVTEDGGGVRVINANSKSHIWIKNCTLMSNSAKNGGGMYIEGEAKVELSGKNIISNNLADGNGGGVYLDNNSDTHLVISNGSTLIIDGNKVGSSKNDFYSPLVAKILEGELGEGSNIWIKVTESEKDIICGIDENHMALSSCMKYIHTDDETMEVGGTRYELVPTMYINSSGDSIIKVKFVDISSPSLIILNIPDIVYRKGEALLEGKCQITKEDFYFENEEEEEDKHRFFFSEDGKEILSNGTLNMEKQWDAMSKKHGEIGEYVTDYLIIPIYKALESLDGETIPESGGNLNGGGEIYYGSIKMKIVGESLSLIKLPVAKKIGNKFFFDGGEVQDSHGKVVSGKWTTTENKSYGKVNSTFTPDNSNFAEISALVPVEISFGRLYYHAGAFTTQSNGQGINLTSQLEDAVKYLDEGGTLEFESTYEVNSNTSIRVDKSIIFEGSASPLFKVSTDSACLILEGGSGHIKIDGKGQVKQLLSIESGIAKIGGKVDITNYLLGEIGNNPVPVISVVGTLVLDGCKIYDNRLGEANPGEPYEFIRVGSSGLLVINSGKFYQNDLITTGDDSGGSLIRVESKSAGSVVINGGEFDDNRGGHILDGDGCTLSLNGGKFYNNTTRNGAINFAKIVRFGGEFDNNVVGQFSSGNNWVSTGKDDLNVDDIIKAYMEGVLAYSLVEFDSGDSISHMEGEGQQILPIILIVCIVILSLCISFNKHKRHFKIDIKKQNKFKF